jgi:ATP-dependent DNA helicase PIF1
MEEITLTPEQEHIINLCKKGENFLITGSAGSSKSFCIRQIKSDAEARGKNVQVCAMTGCAAILLECGAKTLHSWAGIGLGKGSTEDIIKKLYRNTFIKQMYRKTDILIIDEVSMLSMKLFEMLDDIARVLRFPYKNESVRFGETIGNYVRSSYPFGGLQIICSGDFFQLPPIGDTKEERAFCFESPRWKDTFGENQIQLKRIFRQKDPVFSTILNQIRVGKLTKKSNDLLCQYVQREVRLDGGVFPTKIFPTKNKVERWNLQKMAELPKDTEVYTYQMKIKYNASSGNPMEVDTHNMLTQSQCSDEQLEREYTYLKNNILCDSEVKLKVGAQVMCIYNYDVGSPQPICNGSQGLIVSFQPAPPSVETDFPNPEFPPVFPEVLFQNGRRMLITPHIWKSDKIIGLGVEQIPLILSWAITIHKSQGATLEMAELDVGGDIFECGQTYVAMSRVKSLEGLYLTSFDYRRIQIHPKVRAFYDALDQQPQSQSQPTITASQEKTEREETETEEREETEETKETEEIPTAIAVPILEPEVRQVYYKGGGGRRV